MKAPKDNQSLYTSAAYKSSKTITETFSSSFSMALLLVSNPKRQAIYTIYAFVRLVDEVVDTWRPKDSSKKLSYLEQETKLAIKSGYSTNIVVHAFAQTVNIYRLPSKFITAFFKSMRADIKTKHHNKASYQAYIYGSAEVVGLMCLWVFCGGDKKLINKLTPGASALGSAFQKVNFLRDLQSDQSELGRVYFPNLNAKSLTEVQKRRIIKEIEQDFRKAKTAIGKLPVDSQYAVWLAFRYYTALLKEINMATTDELWERRIRINTIYKSWLFVLAWLKRALAMLTA